MKNDRSFLDTDAELEPDREHCIRKIWGPEPEFDEPKEKRVVPHRGVPLSPLEAAQTLRSNFRVSQLERQMRIAMDEIAELKEAIAATTIIERGASAAENSADDPRLMDVIAVTNDIFSGNPTVEIEDDPENPGNPFVVFTVRAGGSPKDLVNRRMEWHKRISTIRSGTSGRYRLAIYPTHESK